MIKYIKEIIRTLKNKWFRKKEVVVAPTPAPKPEHCGSHKRFRKSCPVCVEVIK